MKKQFVLLIFTMLVFSALRAQETRIDCDKPQTQEEMNICSFLEYKKTDSMMNAEYKKMIQSIELTIQNADDPEIKTRYTSIKTNLALSQNSWVQMRDAHGEIMRSIYTGESSQVMAVNLTLMGETDERIKTLNEIFELLTEER